MRSTADEVARCVAVLLDLEPPEVELDRPLQELGMESFAAVRLHRRIAERIGVRLPLQELVGATVDSVARAVDDRRQDTENGERSEDAPPVPTGSASSLVETGEAPLTPIQAAYWVGRAADLPLGGVATFYYVEFDRDPGRQVAADPEAELALLEGAWNRLVDRHAMLRAVVTDDGRQRVLPLGQRYRIGVTDLRGQSDGEVDAALRDLRDDRSHQVRPSGRWPLFDVHAALLPSGTIRVCLGVDVLVLDLASWVLLMRQWGTLVADPSASLPEPGQGFLDLVRQRDLMPARREWERDRDHWLGRLSELPPGPRLPLATPVGELRRPRFHRHAGWLGPEPWAALNGRAATHGLSPTGLLMAAFGLTLTRWGATDEFCLNTTLFDRPDDRGDAASTVGDLSTTMLVALPRVDMADWQGFAAYAQRVNTRFWADLEHRAFSGVEVQRAQQDPTLVPRYPVVFTSGVGLGQASGPAGHWLGDEVFGVSQTPQVLLDHIVWDEAGGLRVAWDVVDVAFPRGVVEGMLEAYLRLLRLLAEDGDAWHRPDLGWDPSFRLPDPPPPQLAPGSGPLLADPQRRVAADEPDGAAVVGPDGAVSHGALRARAATVARALSGAGVGPGDRVAVAFPKSVAQLVAVYGVLDCGASFVPVEPDWPAPRVAAVCSRADIAHALVPAGRVVGFPADVATVQLDEAGRPVADDLPVGSPAQCGPDELAYTIFTSGSSGEPKGVAVEHRAARTTIDDINDRFDVGPNDRVLALSALSFDLAIYDVFGVLGAGGALVIPEPERQRDPGHWCERIGTHRVTVWNTAPALLEMLVEFAEADPAAASELGSLRLVLLSGDWIPVTLPDRLRALVPGARVISLGGATEASIWSIHHPIDRVDPGWRSIPYGRPLRGQFLHVLDAEGRPCPVEAPGELYVAGDGLARGYVGDPDQTAQRFAVHPTLGERLYRTGDLGRWRPDGTIEFLGRADRQVKIRGHRIELGEIESVVNRLPGVRQCVAAAVPGADDRPRLVAYVVGQSEAPEPAELAEAVAGQLPEYMLPTRWVALDSVPLTANGKVDQARLPNPFRSEPWEPPASAATEPWIVAAVREAHHRGLSLAVRIGGGTGTGTGTGTLSESEVPAAASEWARDLRAAADAASVRLIETPCPGPSEHGLVELADVGDDAEPARVSAVAPDLQRTVTAVFEEILGPGVDPETTFHDLGATSVTLVVAHRRLRERVAPHLALLDLFAHPSARALAARIAALDTAAHATDPGAPAHPPPELDLTAATARGRRRADNLQNQGPTHAAP